MLGSETDDSAISNESTSYILSNKKHYITNMIETDTSSYNQSEIVINKKYEEENDFSDEISSFNCDIPSELYSEVGGKKVFRLLNEIEHVKDDTFKPIDFTKRNTKFNNILKKNGHLTNVLNDRSKNQTNLTKNSFNNTNKTNENFNGTNNSNNIDFNGTMLKSILNDNYENQKSVIFDYLKGKSKLDISSKKEYIPEFNSKKNSNQEFSSKISFPNNLTGSTLKPDLSTKPENYFRKNNETNNFSKFDSKKNTLFENDSIDIFRNYSNNVTKFDETDSCFLKIDDIQNSKNNYSKDEADLENLSPIKPMSFKANFIKTPFKNCVNENRLELNDTEVSKTSDIIDPKKFQSTFRKNGKIDEQMIRENLKKEIEKIQSRRILQSKSTDNIKKSLNSNSKNEKITKLEAEKSNKTLLLRNSKVSDLDLYNFDKNENNLDYISSIMKKNQDKNYSETEDDEISSIKITKSLLDDKFDNETSSFSLKTISFSKDENDFTRMQNETISNKTNLIKNYNSQSNKTLNSKYNSLKDNSYLHSLTSLLDKVKDLEIKKKKLEEHALKRKKEISSNTVSLSSLKSLNSSSVDLTDQLNDFSLNDKSFSVNESDQSFYSLENSKNDMPSEKLEESFHCKCCRRNTNGYQLNKYQSGSSLEKKKYSKNKNDDNLINLPTQQDFNVSLNEIFKKKCSKAFNNIQNRRNLIQQKIQQRKENERLKELEKISVNKKIQKLNQAQNRFKKFDVDLSKKNSTNQLKLNRNMTMILMKK